jgi:hypothetical protein
MTGVRATEAYRRVTGACQNRYMARRSLNLLERGPDFIGEALTHPAQIAACRAIEDLIGRLEEAGAA